MDKRGQGISMTYIVIAALALIVLIVIFLFFTGALSEMFSRQTEVVEGATQESAVDISKCKLYAALGQEESWENNDCDTVMDETYAKYVEEEKSSVEQTPDLRRNRE